MYAGQRTCSIVSSLLHARLLPRRQLPQQVHVEAEREQLRHGRVSSVSMSSSKSTTTTTTTTPTTTTPPTPPPE